MATIFTPAVSHDEDPFTLKEPPRGAADGVTPSFRVAVDWQRGYEPAGRGSSLTVGALLPVVVKSLSRLKDGKVIGVVDEDVPEEPGRQHTVESLYAGILLGASEAEEGHAGQFEGADFHVLR